MDSVISNQQTLKQVIASLLERGVETPQTPLRHSEEDIASRPLLDHIPLSTLDYSMVGFGGRSHSRERQWKLTFDLNSPVSS